MAIILRLLLWKKSNYTGCFSELLINDNAFSHLTLRPSTVTSKDSVFHLFHSILHAALLVLTMPNEKHNKSSSQSQIADP